MSEQNNTVDSGAAQQQDKTFTQDDVNRIIQERLAKEKAKGDSTLAEREQELAKREFQLKAKEILAEKKLPAEILGAIKCDTEEELNASLALLEEQFDIGSSKPVPKVIAGGTGGSNPGHSDQVREAMGLK
jgi:hypothetical protein